MSEPSETSGHPLAPTTKQEKEPENNTINLLSSTHTKHRKSSQPSDDCSEVSKSTNPRRRPGSTTKAPSGPHAGPSRSKQQSTTHPASMMSQSSSINYTRTGRISKAKKGLKVHNCECGRSYTRAEHLRRHQKNHAQDDALVCDYPECGKTFYRLDLLHRHQERHSELGSNSRQVDFSDSGSPEPTRSSVQDVVSSNMPTISRRSTSFHYPTPSVVTSAHEQPTLPRYTVNPFRTPEIPRTPRLPLSGFITRSSPTSRSNSKHIPHTSRHYVPVAVSADGMSSQIGWHEPPYSQQSPGYTSSSGYASPNIGPGDYGLFPNMAYAHGANRTRTPSNASVNDQWSFTPQSPSSSISTMPYGWPSHDKMATEPGLAYINTSYPMASLGISSTLNVTTSYGQFEPRTMIQRDEDEAGILFRDQPYGMGQITNTYPSEQYLNNYWRLFHPTFPIVHRSTYGGMSSSPMLRAAMIAIDGQYSNDTNSKRSSRVLHDRCIKLLAKREREPMSEPDRLCDHQTVFLVEILSQYRARRAAKTLSPRFGTLYHKAAGNFTHATSRLSDIVLSLARHENVTLSRWLQWIELSTWQRLLASCYILESQQATLLAREPSKSLFQGSGMDLPFPTHSSIWDAATLDEWAVAAQQYSAPQYVFEVTQESMLVPCDSFQSSVLIAAYYNCFNTSSPYANSPSLEEVDYVLDRSFATKQKLLTAKLLQVIPVRALLAVSGESWILSEKVPSPQAFTTLKTTLRTWVTQLWSAPTAQSQFVAIKEALRLSVEILQMALDQQPDAFTLGMGTDMGLYFAALVLWAVTTVASTRMKASQQLVQHTPHRHQSQPPSFASSQASVSVPSTPIQQSTSFTAHPTLTSSPIQSSVPGLTHSQPTTPTRHDSLATTTLLSHDQITFNSNSFLPVILSLVSTDLASQRMLDLGTLQAGCISMLLWVKLQLRDAPLEEQTDLAIWASGPGDGLGELMDSVVGSLERILNRGWTGWGI